MSTEEQQLEASQVSLRKVDEVVRNMENQVDKTPGWDATSAKQIMCQFVSIVSSHGQVFILVKSLNRERVRLAGEGLAVTTREGQSHSCHNCTKVSNDCKVKVYLCSKSYLSYYCSEDYQQRE